MSEETARMRVCVLGAGAVGGHIAARLDRGEADVSVVARGDTLRAIQQRGLRVELAEGTVVTHPVATDRVDDLPPQDVVIVAVKAPSLPAVADQVAALLAPEGLAVFVLNGIPWWYPFGESGPAGDLPLRSLDPRGDLQNLVGVDRSIGAVAYTAGEVVEPGVIRTGNPRNRLVLGRPDGRLDARLDALASALAPGGLDAEVTTRIRDAIWKKLTMNLVGGSLAVLSSSPMKHVLNLPGVMHTAEEMATEAAAIARALGCDPGDTDEGLARLARSGHLQSIAQDLHAGRPMEIDALFRVPLQLGARAGVAAPRLNLLVELATQRARAAGCYTDVN